MNREDIEKVAVDYAYKEWARGGFKQASQDIFIAGAKWRINSVWHDVKEKPNFLNIPILLQHRHGHIHFIDTVPASWIYVQKHYTNWAYVKDLLPIDV